ncbi:hypothetical protein BN59_00523 [Legionella massiliensis]|uniref:Phasin protein n=1 Tax=Legionella massiliensis TaxID=1034943 RepID=A0A078KT62_9GAMM|nr:hypothetical protein [Legionella massiliensis]CDZ76256.1 hypothetical protein BN59_00523 [Legionella massiliensis]CEE11994.1 hypothetical protein BN1094_00523 [Legionella massiliensis]
MQTTNIEQLENTLNSIQQPVKEVVALNIRVLQNLSYPNVEELAKIRRPEDILEKNLDALLHNGHTVLDYMQQAFNIYERQVLSVTDNLRANTEQILNEAKLAFNENMLNHPDTR